ncbi:MAG: hypothetical protein DHS20C16_06190 [Phycisphaerae bacterium]|nr:MAG: hypothetical protein DHS20C16_06190 [Phycisphaerae bacterium]
MPTYDYECEACGHVFEMFQSITARAKRKPEDACEGCGKHAPIRRLIGSGGAVIFKGDGFYETDYRSDSYKKAAKADKESQSGSTDKSGSSDKSSKSDTSGTKKESTADKASSSTTTSSSSDKPAKKATDS